MEIPDTQADLNYPRRAHLDWIDWMKCAGIFIIVYGHVAGSSLNLLTPPIYPKQLGVAFFVFVMGYSLAKEYRSPATVVFRRLFTIFFFGIAIALALSTINFIANGTVLKSNYAPFLAGINVLFDFFPANPTTWFIGTYLHLLLLWAFILRRLKLSLALLASALLLEILLRAILICAMGEFVAYMMFPNWLNVLLWGIFCGRSRDLQNERSSYIWIPSCIFCLLIWIGFVCNVKFGAQFPFRMIEGTPQLAGAIVISLMVSFLYISFSLLFYFTARNLPAPSWAKFIARNTIIIFILHMPVFSALRALHINDFGSHALYVALYLSVCFFGTSMISELITKLIKPELQREKILNYSAVRYCIARFESIALGGNITTARVGGFH